ncbi:MAG: 6-phosphogluconolactonase [Spirochaetia bacterium]
MSVQTIAYPDAEALAEGASALALEKIRKALDEGRSAVTALAGGTTPKEAYRLLAREITSGKLPVDRMIWLFGDERWVLPDGPKSNEAMARESLLGPIGAPASTIISWDAGTGDPVACAARYAEKARPTLEGAAIDLVLLGMGADGHTASLFPDGVAHFFPEGSMPVGPDIPGFAVAVYSQSAGGWRLTLCPGVLRAARTVAFLVTGEEKAAAFRRARSGDPRTPAAWILGGTTMYLATRNALGSEAVDFGREIRHG